MNNIFNTKNVFIVGGSSGIGLALVRAFVMESAKVTVQGLHGNPVFDKLCHTHDIKTLKCDLQDKNGQKAMCLHAGTADILCIAYGPFLQKPLENTTETEWEQTVYANLISPGIAVSAALPHMKKQKWGRILFFGGTHTHTLRGFKTNAVYGAAKTGLMSLVRSISTTYAGSGITANAICPGFTDTGLLTHRQRQEWMQKSPDGTLLNLDSIAAAALFLLKNADYNGIIMPIDKGWTSYNP